MMKPKKYVYKYGGRIFETIQVTAENLHEAADWCWGQVYLSVIDGTPVGVIAGARIAYCGDWIIKNEYEWMEDVPIRYSVCEKDAFGRLFNEVDDGSDE